jgi:protease-4
MKVFFQSLLGSLAAGAIFIFWAGVAVVVLIMGLASIGSEPPLVEIEPDSVLVFDLNTTIQDAPVHTGLEAAVLEALGEGYAATYLLKVVDAIERAAMDDDIAALFLHGSLQNEAYGSGLGVVSEIRQALLRFKATGKPVYAYIVDPAQKDYYLASVADEIWMNPFGLVSLNGLAVDAPFLGSALKKYGIGVQTTRVGEYKSAGEMFTRDGMSDADREQTSLLLGNIWSELLQEIGATRDLGFEQLERLSNETAFFSAEEAMAARLVDRVGYLDELIEYFSQTFEQDDFNESFRQVNLLDYALGRGFETDSRVSDGERIAVVYAEGDLVDGYDSIGFVGGDWLAYELRRLRLDPEVKAVVLRVNSPGGSAVASEIVQRETRLLAEEKALVVSMGSYAASGGYWISAYADRIFAQPYTITGSIGVFGLIFNIEGLAENLELHFDGVKTAPFADIYTLTRPRNEEEMALIQKFTDQIYDAFIQRVAEGRSIAPEKVREIAQGRVWSGASAIRLNLIDEIGGLQAAINEALDSAGMDHYAIEQVPSVASFAENLAMMLEDQGVPPVARSSNLVERLASEYDNLNRKLESLNDPRGVYARMPFGLDRL